MFEDWDWTDTMSVIGVLIVVAFIAFVGTLIFAPKNVDYYYLSHGGGNTASTCVYAHWTWHSDEVSFCTDDKDKALDFVTRANASLKH